MIILKPKPQIFNKESQTQVIWNVKNYVSRYSQYRVVNSHTSTIYQLGLRTQLYKTTLQGGHMRIKFLRRETITTAPNASGKTYPMVRIIGEALEG